MDPSEALKFYADIRNYEVDVCRDRGARARRALGLDDPFVPSPVPPKVLDLTPIETKAKLARKQLQDSPAGE